MKITFDTADDLAQLNKAPISKRRELSNRQVATIYAMIHTPVVTGIVAIFGSLELVILSFAIHGGMFLVAMLISVFLPEQ